MDKIVLLDNDTYKTEEGINIVGCTLWSNPPKHVFEKLADKYTIDYDDHIEEHKKSMEFLENLENEKINMIITHHCPNPNLINEKYTKSPLNSGFYTDCSKVYNKLNGIFVYGHTHSSSDMVVGNVRFVCNPYGYPNENKGDKNKILNIRDPRQTY
jgi:predicted phosphodiesterase